MREVSAQQGGKLGEASLSTSKQRNPKTQCGLQGGEEEEEERAGRYPFFFTRTKRGIEGDPVGYAAQYLAPVVAGSLNFPEPSSSCRCSDCCSWLSAVWKALCSWPLVSHDSPQ